MASCEISWILCYFAAYFTLNTHGQRAVWVTKSYIPLLSSAKSPQLLKLLMQMYSIFHQALYRCPKSPKIYPRIPITWLMPCWNPRGRMQTKYSLKWWKARPTVPWFYCSLTLSPQANYLRMLGFSFLVNKMKLMIIATLWLWLLENNPGKEKLQVHRTCSINVSYYCNSYIQTRNSLVCLGLA